MAPLPVQSTGRAWLDYQTGGGATSENHTVMTRFNPGTGGSFAGALTAMAFLITELGATSFFDGWSVTGARYANDESVISLPAPVPAALVSFVGSGQAVASIQSQARETRFVGRGGLTGRRVSFSLYGLVDGLFNEADFRVARGEANFVDRVLDVLEELDTGYFNTISSEPATWQQYANWQFNSYWERRLRV